MTDHIRSAAQVRAAEVTPNEAHTRHAGSALTVLLSLTGIAVVAGAVLRLALLDTGSLWLDELWTLDAVSRSFREMVGARLVSDQSPPLWTVLTWLWLQGTRTYDPGMMRLLPALFGLVAIAAPIAGAVRLPRLRPTLLVMGSLVALSLFTVQYSVELRAYSMMIALGAVATVVWAGLLTNDLPRSGRWIFLFALTGALGGFGHYYGNLLYVVESAVLLLVFAGSRARRPLVLHVVWGAVSVIPVIAWYIFTRPWARDEAVAVAPSLAEIQTWSAYALSPVTNVVVGVPPGYAETSQGIGMLVLGGAAAAIVGTSALASFRSRGTRLDGVSRVGLGSLIVVVGGLGAAWTASLLLPPSMNTRNLSSLLPPLFLLLASACTLPRQRVVRLLTGSGAVGAFLVAAIILITQHGISSVAPPWQLQAGYRDATRLLISSSQQTPTPTLIGVEAAWDWHGQWDAAMAAHLDAGPRMPSDESPLPVVWVLTASEVPGDVPEGPVIVFADDPDARAVDVFAWAEETRGGCERRTFGGPGFGRTEVLLCD